MKAVIQIPRCRAGTLTQNHTSTLDRGFPNQDLQAFENLVTIRNVPTMKYP